MSNRCGITESGPRARRNQRNRKARRKQGAPVRLDRAPKPADEKIEGNKMFAVALIDPKRPRNRQVVQRRQYRGGTKAQVRSVVRAALRREGSSLRVGQRVDYLPGV